MLKVSALVDIAIDVALKLEINNKLLQKVVPKYPNPAVSPRLAGARQAPE